MSENFRGERRSDEMSGKVIIDVREKDEFEAEHIENSIHVPLSQFGKLAPGVLNGLHQKEVWIMCRGGNRAKLAAAQVEQLGYSDKIRAQVFTGGILEWKRQGKPTVLRRKGHFPVMRQVQLVAGFSVVLSNVLGLYVHPAFHYVSVFFGAGILIAGATGYCGMAHLLARLPWNKSNPLVSEDLCQVKSNS